MALWIIQIQLHTFPLLSSPKTITFLVFEVLSYSSVRLFDKVFVLNLQQRTIETIFTDLEMRGTGLGSRCTEGAQVYG